MPARRAGGVLGQSEPGLRVPPSVEHDEALAEQGEPFGGIVASFLGSTNGLVEVGDRGVMVTALGGIPDELAHQRRRFGLGRLQFAPHVGSPGVTAEEDICPRCALLQGSARWREHGVSLVQTADLLAQIGHAQQVEHCPDKRERSAAARRSPAP